MGERTEPARLLSNGKGTSMKVIYMSHQPGYPGNERGESDVPKPIRDELTAKAKIMGRAFGWYDDLYGKHETSYQSPDDHYGYPVYLPYWSARLED